MLVIKEENNLMGCFSVSTDIGVETPVTRLICRFFFFQYSIFSTSSKVFGWVLFFSLFYSTSTLSQPFNFKSSPDSMEDVPLTFGFLNLGVH